MKKYFSLLLFFSLFAFNNIFAQPNEEGVDLNKDKGVLMYGSTIYDSKGPLHYIKMYSKNLNDIEKVAPVDPNDDGLHLDNFRCAAFDGTRYFGYIVKIYTVTERAKAFVSFDYETKQVTTIANLDPLDDTWPILYEMTYDHTNKKCYALGRNSSAPTTDLYEVNTSNGTYTKVHSFDFYAWAMAADYDGKLYLIKGKPDANGEFYMGSLLVKIDPSNSFSEISQTELKANGNAIIPNYTHTMDMDHENNQLYWFCDQNDAYQRLYGINPSSGDITEYGTIPFNKIISLYIPFIAADNREAAGKVTDLKASSPATEPLSTTITWKNPTKNWRGNNLTELHSIKIARETPDNVIATIETNNIGGDMTWTDNTAPAGINTYYLIAYRKNGEKGLLSSVKVFVGPDTPGAVMYPFAYTENDNVKIGWQKPVSSAHGKEYDEASLTYDIIRNPGNTTVVSNLTTTEYTDTELGFFNQYTYSIIAKNNVGVGTEAKTYPLYAGKGYIPPFADDFSTELNAARWQSYDANGDLDALKYSGEKFDVFQDFRVTLNWNHATNDYMFSPKLALEGGKRYKISLDAKLGLERDVHHFAITYGKEATPDAQIEIKKFTDLIASQKEDVLPTSVTFSIKETGNYHIGIHCTSEPSASLSYFGVDNFKIEEVHDNDLAAVNLNIKKEIAVNKETVAKVRVMNVGGKDQNNFIVQVIKADGTILGGTTVTSTLKAGESEDYEVRYTPTVEGSYILQGLVLLDTDQDTSNDLTDMVEVEVNQTGSLDWNIELRDQSGDQSSTEPMAFHKQNSTTETVYRADELGGKECTILGIAYEYSSLDDLQEESNAMDLEIYMSMEDKEDLYNKEDPTSQWSRKENMTHVFSGTFTISPGKNLQLPIKFTKPFKYDGKQNLVVQVWKNGQVNNAEYPATFNIYAGEGWTYLRTLRYNGMGPFSYSEKSFAVNGKPVTFFSVEYSPVNGINDTTNNDNALDRGYIIDTNGQIHFDQNIVSNISIYDIQGRLIEQLYSGKNTTSSMVSKGMYIIKVSKKNGTTQTYKSFLGK